MMILLQRILAKLIWDIHNFVAPDARKMLGTGMFRNGIMDPHFPWKQYEGRLNPYYLKYGFRISTLESEYYSRCSGVKSDLYMPLSLYYRFLYPYLNNDAWRWGFVDKNMLARLLSANDTRISSEVLVPESIAYCQNGRFFKAGSKLCTREEAIDAVLTYSDDLIVKPSIYSSHGHGVIKLYVHQKNRQSIEQLFQNYGSNFVIQEVVRQHPDLSAFNPTSVNTIRIATYQDFEGRVKILYSSLRFGGKGKVYDNADDADGSGGFCAILPDGSITRVVHHYRKMKTERLDDNLPAVIPYFQEIRNAVTYLHTLLPQFAFIGWDMSVTRDGHPVVIEFNLRPGLGSAQLAHGPLFEKDDLDEIMKRVSRAECGWSRKISVKFPDAPHYGL